MEHLFRDCEVAKRIWVCSELGIKTTGCTSISLTHWIINWMAYLEKMNDAEFHMVRFLATLWCLWGIRNRMLFKREPFHPTMFFNMWTQVVRTADMAIEKALKAKDVDIMNEQDSLENEFVRIRNSNPVHMIGVAHSCERVRVMVDAGWKSMCMAGIGWVALTGTGNRFYEFSKALVAESATQAEAIGVKEVLLWAKSSGYWHLEISSDCKRPPHSTLGLTSVPPSGTRAKSQKSPGETFMEV
ncbi:uncharacterized protein LOC141620611 [Silene latifolia]|uniref:uncharacterized protein LOC141620611 n=1 Tax=Silene latifolia TaxID=37657 RepID=UPI003D776691